ncbi:UDP-galactopyranose mutase [Desulfitobacterium hafniense]|nr:UDP-galactopyranose mutase [Desulfitobacterium hafniense]
MNYDYLIVGAGLFGATFAHQMALTGKKCLVIDRRHHVGGNVYTEKTADIHVHKYGAHIFHTNNRAVWDFINQFTEFNHYINSPIANYKGEIYNLPFNMNTFNKMWGVVTPAQAQEIIEQQRAEITDGQPQNLEQQALCLVGRDIYEKLIKGYTEKQWGMSCSELPASIIKRLPVRFIYDNNYFSDRFQGIPIDGYTSIIGKMLAHCDVKLSTDYSELYSSFAPYTIYTGAIDEYYNYCYGELEYRSLRFETEIMDTSNYQGNAVVNYCEREIPYTRIIEHKHFAFGTQPLTVITREYPQPWEKGSEAYYPINNEKNNALYQRYQALAARNQKVIFAGRLGSYQYYDMDKTIANALCLASSLKN